MNNQGIIKVSFHKGEGELAYFEDISHLDKLLNLLLGLKGENAQIFKIEVMFDE